MTEQQLLDKITMMMADVMHHKGYAERVKEELEELKKAKEKENVSLRDQFAMAALQSLLAVNDFTLDDSYFYNIAKDAFKLADAMLAMWKE